MTSPTGLLKALFILLTEKDIVEREIESELFPLEAHPTDSEKSEDEIEK